MKGVVFTGFLQMIEDNHHYDEVDAVINETPEASGVYTAVGTYPHTEIVALLMTYCRRNNVEVSDALEQFGAYLFQMFKSEYPSFFGASGAVDFLSGINDRIHSEVIKLYPDAELPRFELHEGPSGFELNYFSPRSMSYLALGLIKSAIDHFGDGLRVEHDILNPEGTEAKFKLIKKGE